MEKICPVCNKQFRVSKSQQARKYCCHACYSIDKVKHHNIKKTERGWERLCPLCKQVIVTATPSYKELCKPCATREATKKRFTPKGKEAIAWRGGRRVDTYGYVRVHKPEHPFADSTNYVREHIFVMVEHIGKDRFVELGGCVHHIDGDKQNNSLDNLYVCTRQQNIKFTAGLLKIAYSLVRTGHILFKDGEYTCPLFLVTE